MRPPSAPQKHGAGPATGVAQAAMIATDNTAQVTRLRPIHDRISWALGAARRWQAQRALAAHGLQVRDLLVGEIGVVRSRLPDPGPGPSNEELRRQARQEIGVATAWAGEHAVAVGYVDWRGPRHQELLEIWPAVPEIYRLHVLPAYRSHGVGAQLVHFFEHRAQRLGRARIGLGVHRHNLQALDLYRRLGYGPEATPFTDEYLDPSSGAPRQVVHEPALFLVRELGPG